MHSLTFYKISLGFSILEWGWQPNKEGLKQTCVKNCEDSEIVPYLKLVNWPTIVSWMLAEATRFLWQRQKSSWQRIHIYSNSPSLSLSAITPPCWDLIFITIFLNPATVYSVSFKKIQVTFLWFPVPSYNFKIVFFANWIYYT